MDICKLLGDPPIRDFFCLLWFCFLCGFVFHFVSKWFLLLFFVVCVVGLLLLLLLVLFVVVWVFWFCFVFKCCETFSACISQSVAQFTSVRFLILDFILSSLHPSFTKTCLI